MCEYIMTLENLVDIDLDIDYEYKVLENRTIEDMTALDLNKSIIADLKLIDKNQLLEIAINYIDMAKVNGRKIRSEMRTFLQSLLKILYSHLNLKDGQCYPSMKTIAYELEPGIRQSTDDDSYEARIKERRLATLKMQISRGVSILKAIGLINTHIFRAETNRENDGRLPNFFYQILAPEIEAYMNLITRIKEEIEKRKESNKLGFIEKAFSIVQDFMFKERWYGSVEKLFEKQERGLDYRYLRYTNYMMDDFEVDCREPLDEFMRQMRESYIRRNGHIDYEEPSEEY